MLNAQAFSARVCMFFTSSLEYHVVWCHSDAQTSLLTSRKTSRMELICDYIHRNGNITGRITEALDLTNDFA